MTTQFTRKIREKVGDGKPQTENFETASASVTTYRLGSVLVSN